MRQGRKIFISALRNTALTLAMCATGAAVAASNDANSASTPPLPVFSASAQDAELYTAAYMREEQTRKFREVQRELEQEAASTALDGNIVSGIHPAALITTR